MSLYSFGQQIIALEPKHEIEVHDIEPISLQEAANGPFSGHDIKDFVKEHCVPEDSLEVEEPGDITILIEDLPGAPPGTKDPEILEVSEDDKDSKDSKDNNDVKIEKDSKWNWKQHGPKGFVVWIKERLSGIPQHSGYDSSGLERAMSYLEKLDKEISNAMRTDLDGELDSKAVEHVRSQIDDGISRLNDRLNKVKKTSKSKRSKKASEEESIVKTAQKIAGIQGTQIVYTGLVAGIGRICINSTISAGKDIEDTFEKLATKYKLDDREKFEVINFINDCGFALNIDRGLVGEKTVRESEDNFDVNPNYQS